MTNPGGNDQQHHEYWESFAAGWAAGFVSVAATYPIHKTMFRQV